MRFNDAVIGIALIVAAAAMVWFTLDFPAMPGQKYGPDLFPRIIAGGIGLCGLILIGKGLRSGAPLLRLADWTRQAGPLAAFLAIPIVLVLYIVVSPVAGFLLTAIALTYILLLLLRWRPVTSLAIAIAAAVVIQQAFTRLLLVPLPRGVLEGLLG